MAGPADVVTTPERRRAFEADGSWDTTTIGARVADHAARCGEFPAVTDLLGRRCRTWAELDRDAERVAAFLTDSGVGPGDVVGVQLPNWYETVAIDLGAWKLGAVLNPLLPVYRAKELHHTAMVARTKVLFTPDEYRGFDHVGLVEGLRSTLPDLRRHVVVTDPERNADAFAKWLEPFPATGRASPVDAGAVSELIFSSGTEAEPKAIMHTEQTANAAMRAAHSALGFRSGDVMWMPSPVGHSTGLNYGARLALYHGLPLVLQDRWSAAAATALVEAQRCTYTVAATTFLSDFIHDARACGRDVGSLRLFCSGGAPVPPELVAGAEELGITVLRLYGSTESLVATWNRPGTPRHKRIETDGPPLDHVEVEVRDEAGAAVTGTPGEIFTRGPAHAVGYFDDPERTAAAFTAEGWVRSGDVGVLDDEGYLRIVGRKKEIIIRGGINIAPREIEDVISELPQVGAVAVVGLPDARLGELVCACVVLRDGDLDLEALVGYLRSAGLALYKMPQRLVVLDALPMTPTGKIRKFELVARVADDRTGEDHQ